MSVPPPEPGQVISYRYLWRNEYERDQSEGRKQRPCVVVIAKRIDDEKITVLVAPITHSPPSEAAIEIPLRVKLHLGLDDQQSWVILQEMNQFVWPGFDLEQIPGKPGVFEYGYLPPKFFDRIKEGIIAQFEQKKGFRAPRD